MSECVYKSIDIGWEQAIQTLNKLADKFPPGSVCLQAIQPCRGPVRHRYVLASGCDSIYMCFMGTKQLRDIITDVGVAYRNLKWVKRDRVMHRTEKDDAEGITMDGDLVSSSSSPAAHGGYTGRAEYIPVDVMYKYAQQMKKRLVLCG